MLALTEEIRRLNNAFYQKQFERVNASEKKFRRDIERALMIAFLVGVGVSAASIVRIGWLERRFLEQHEQAQRTGEELRHLSTQLRHAQEDERKEISRELHDAVGQKLTALRMELGGMDRLRHGPESEFDERLAEIKQLAEQSLRLIRDLAAGLRPTMLDDLGLQPALQKQARQFSRHTNIPVSVEVEGDLDHLPERHKVYLYRIVQESLTNCARHARAKKISVTMKGGDDSVLVAVEDDGVGFDPAAAAGNGIGLVGIEERARELGGTMDLHSQPGMGTRLEVRIPVNGEST